MKSIEKIYAESYIDSANEKTVWAALGAVMDKLETVLDRKQFIEFESVINGVVSEAEFAAFKTGYRAANAVG